MMVEPGTRFTALTDFYDFDLNSQYLAGMSYTVRAGDKDLARLVPEWLCEGKVRIGGPAAKVQGEG